MGLLDREYMKRDDKNTSGGTSKFTENINKDSDSINNNQNNEPPKVDQKFKKEIFNYESSKTDSNNKNEYFADTKYNYSQNNYYDSDIMYNNKKAVIEIFKLLLCVTVTVLLIYGIITYNRYAPQYIGSLYIAPYILFFLPLLFWCFFIGKRIVKKLFWYFNETEKTSNQMLNDERPLWIQEKDLEQDIIIKHNGKSIKVNIPIKIRYEKEMFLRLKGLGKNIGEKTGNLILNVKLYQKEDITCDLWISEESAKKGVNKKLLVKTGKIINISIPKNTINGSEIVIENYTESILHTLNDPYMEQHIGNIKVDIFVFSNQIQPKYTSFENLSTEEMALEGWVYRKRDEIYQKLGKNYFPNVSMKAWEVADLFNEYGWTGIYNKFREILNITCPITINQSSKINKPGICHIKIMKNDNAIVLKEYAIEINQNFIHNPFFVAAILAHELCHIVSYEKLGCEIINNTNNDKDIQENERLVDLLVFLFGLGDFQLRAARDERITFGYFDQKIFERIYVITSKL